MKCRIDINGNLVIEAVSETEAFALETFGDSFNKRNSDVILTIKPAGAYWVPEANIVYLHKDKKD